jgi:cytochrome c-type biogenesis protein CcsB
MKKVLNIIFSSRSTVLFLLILALAMGAATFVEEKYDTETAKHLVYNAKWFEFLLLLLVLNFIGSIGKYKLFRKEKASAFLFHSAFIVIILGAAITRYTGFNGTMHIRKGEAANSMYSSELYLRTAVEDNGKKYESDFPVHLSQVANTPFDFTMKTDKGPVEFKYKGMIKNAVDTIDENVAGGKSMLGIVVPGASGRETIFITDGEIKDLGKFLIAYNNDRRTDAIRISDKEGKLVILSPYEINRMAMPSMAKDTIHRDLAADFKERCLYDLGGPVFVFKQAYKNAKKHLVAGKGEGGPDALLMDVTINGQTHDAQVLGGSGYISVFQDAGIDGANIKMAYGEKEIELPFSLYLDRFVLERYAGSSSPSSFLSEVTLQDNAKNVNEKHSIFMNHVLDYGGYRFFQTSYDPDEQGTVLSVNHDSKGTMVTYLGYLLMGLGFLLNIFNRNSRFHLLRRSIRTIREKRKGAVAAIALLVCLSAPSFAQNSGIKHISTEHADKFAKLIVQTVNGRFEPVNTLAYDVMHKIARKDVFDVEGVGKMGAVQVLADMPLNVEFWKTQKIIYIREKSVQDVLGIDGKYASFNDFFDDKANYKLRDIAEKTFRKKQADQNAFDKEIIKVDERANVCMMAFNGSLLKIFPDQSSADNSWISWDDSLAHAPMNGSLKILNEDLQLRVFNANNIFGLYLQELYKSTKSGDYSRPDKILGYISSIQRQPLVARIVPSEKMINNEITYNKSKIFVNLRNWYSMLSLSLLALAFIDVLRSKKSKIITFLLNACIVLLAACFVYHTYGLILRWYITGHAPWSSGYEALLLIAWGGLLAGFFFIRNSKITLAATALLAFFILMTAGLSDYDPQLTNLQPVLKSYWLVIHVATITISYGFLGLGFILGLITMFVYLFKNQKNYRRLDMITKELTHINEINLTVGVFLAAVGTFLGGIWANESWGKYWGWDAKETWALVIVITYTIVLHLRFASKLKGEYIFNIGSVLGYASVLMTFFGVNYYLSKGLHSYASGDTPVFPMWAWGAIFSVFALIIGAGYRQKFIKRVDEQPVGTNTKD